MLTLNQLAIQFGGQLIFDDLTFTVKPSDKIGLVGKNGSGKSTLLKILAELQTPDNGEVIKPKAVSYTHLRAHETS